MANAANMPETEAEVMARREKCMALRVAGFTYVQIGKAVGISHEAARKHVQAGLEHQRQVIGESAEELRSVAHSRLEQIINRSWLKALPNKTEEEPDAGAVARIFQAIQIDARIMGYESPQRHQVDLGIVSSCMAVVVERIIKVIPDDAIPLVYLALEEGMEEVHQLANRQTSGAPRLPGG